MPNYGMSGNEEKENILITNATRRPRSVIAKNMN
jgi:hypothetical protein